MAGHLFFCRGDRSHRFRECSRLLCTTCASCLVTTCLSVWAGMDSALRAYGCLRVADLARPRLSETANPTSFVSRATGAERPLELAVFWLARRLTFVCRHRHSVGRDTCHACRLLAHQSAGRSAAGPLLPVGFVCCRAQFLNLAAQSSSIGLISAPARAHTRLLTRSVNRFSASLASFSGICA